MPIYVYGGHGYGGGLYGGEDADAYPSGPPDFSVSLDDGTGTFPYDVTELVVGSTFTITRGTSDGQTTVSPATLSLALENLDGAFTPGDSTYGFRVNQAIRVTITVGDTTSTRFTGYIQSASVSWPDGGDLYCVTAVTASDLMTVLQRRLSRSITEHEVLALSPLRYFTLGDPGPTGGDLSGNSGSPLVATGLSPTGIRTPPAFGAEGPNAWDGLGGAAFVGAAWLQTSLPSTSLTALSVLVAFNLTSVGAFDGVPAGTDAGGFTINRTSGRLVGRLATTASVVTSPSSVLDGAWHVAVLSWDGSTFTTYLDGASFGSASATGTTSATTLAVGTFLTGTAAHVAVFNSALSPTQVTEVTNAIQNGFTADRSDQRIARLLGYAGITTTALEVGLQTSAPAQSTSGTSALDTASTIAAAEGGLLFVRGDGVPVLQNRNHRPLKTSPDWSVVAIDTDESTEYVADTQLYVNYATAKGVTGVEQVAQNAASVAANGQFPASLDLLVATDAEALDAANWLVHTRQNQALKLPSVVIDLAASTPAFQETALAIEISDRLNTSGMPAQIGTVSDLIIEGWTETVTAAAWSMALNTSAQTPYQVAIYDTASATVDTGLPVYF